MDWAVAASLPRGFWSVGVSTCSVQPRGATGRLAVLSAACFPHWAQKCVLPALPGLGGRDRGPRPSRAASAQGHAGGAPGADSLLLQRREEALLQAALCILLQDISAVSVPGVPELLGATSQLLIPLPGCCGGARPSSSFSSHVGVQSVPLPCPLLTTGTWSHPPTPVWGLRQLGAPISSQPRVCLSPPRPKVLGALLSGARPG